KEELPPTKTFTFKPAKLAHEDKPSLKRPDPPLKRYEPPLKRCEPPLKRCEPPLKRCEPPPRELPAFMTGSEKLLTDIQARYGAQKGGGVPAVQKRLGSNRSSPLLGSSFKSPFPNTSANGAASTTTKEDSSKSGDSVPIEHPLYKSIDPKMIELITNEIMDSGDSIHWDDIAGLEFVKHMIQEIVVFPLMRPDIFTGLRGPPKGLLLFGPPGTGKSEK
ncbi:MDM2 oncogene_ E3 ubiquitin protein ligase, partial [Caligus rogercresseyi]